MTGVLPVILKVAERCNINCSYCYVFNGADNSSMQRPALMSEMTMHGIADYLRNGLAVGFERISLDFHGGEPLLLGKDSFDKMCTLFRSGIEHVAPVDFRLQTNGMLIDEEWISLFQQHKIKVGVSLDGPPQYHDANRVDFRGNGTYDAVLRGVKLLTSAHRDNRISHFGILCVINNSNSAAEIYRHVVHDLGIKRMDFLLPDFTHDTFGDTDARSFGTFLCEAFDAWTKDEDPEIEVRLLNSVMSLILGGKSLFNVIGKEVIKVITINGDGSVAPEDTLRACGSDFMNSGLTVFNSSLSDFLHHPTMRRIEREREDRPEKCRSCCWLNVCGSGAMVNRYQQDTGFRNASVYCEGLQMFFAHASGYLLSKGMPMNHLLDVLGIERELLRA